MNGDAMLYAIDTLARRLGFAPSYREIGAYTATSISAVRYRLVALRGAGLVAFEERRSRTVRLTEEGMRRVREGKGAA